MLKTNLAVLMAERGLKISDLYEATGISKTTLMAIADNTGKGIQYDTVDKLCNYLNVSPSEFFIYAPFLVTLSQAVFNDGDYQYNFGCSVKNGEQEANYNIGINYYGKTYPSAAEDLNDIYKNLSPFDFVIHAEVSANDFNDDGTFFEFYQSLPIQFQNTLKNSLFSRAINNANRDKAKYFSFDEENKKAVFPTISSYLKSKKSISVLFALTRENENNIYVEKNLKVKDSTIVYK